MKKFLALIIFALSISTNSFAQKTDDAKDALAVVDKLFAEMANHNPEAIKAVHTADSQLVAIIKNKEGKSVVRTLDTEAFSKNFAEKRSEIKEDMYAPKVEVFGDLALVWGRYVFFVNGKISHCGANSFHLVRTETGWKIANASSTIDAAGCTAEEKAMKVAAKTN